jgi:hypothetical protein
MKDNAADLAAPTEAPDRRSTAEAPLTETPGQLIRDAQQLLDAANAIMRAAVVAERTRDTSWGEIGEVLGVGKSSAHGRFAGAMNEFVDAAEAGSTMSAQERATADLDRAWGEAFLIMARRGQRDEIMQVADLITRGPEAVEIEAKPGRVGGKGAEEASKVTLSGVRSGSWLDNAAAASREWRVVDPLATRFWGGSYSGLVNPSSPLARTIVGTWGKTSQGPADPADMSELGYALALVVRSRWPQLPESKVHSAFEEALQRILSEDGQNKDEKTTTAPSSEMATLQAMEVRMAEASRKLDELEARQADAERSIREALAAAETLNAAQRQPAVLMVPVGPRADPGQGAEDDTQP